MTESPSRRLATIALQASASAVFAALALLLSSEAKVAPPRTRAVELALAAGAGGLSLLSAYAAVALARAGALTRIRARATAGHYLQALLAAFVLSIAAARAGSQRPALTAFCIALSAWILALGFGIVPRLFFTSAAIIDLLGRRLAFAQLTWFALRPLPGEPTRFLLECGSERAVLLRARLAEDGAKLRRALRAQGIREGTPG
jgi:hypothetical protein